MFTSLLQEIKAALTILAGIIVAVILVYAMVVGGHKDVNAKPCHSCPSSATGKCC